MLSKKHVAVYFESNYDMEILYICFANRNIQPVSPGVSRMHIMLCMVILRCVALPF